jgi:hypothetical protein
MLTMTLNLESAEELFNWIINDSSPEKCSLSRNSVISKLLSLRLIKAPPTHLSFYDILKFMDSKVWLISPASSLEY